MDTLTAAERSERMSRIRSTDTKPELVIRRMVHSMGFRYRLHSSSLPGRPDLVFPSRWKAVFVNGCFWHRHEGCKKAGLPKSRISFWKAKLNENVKRDVINRKKLAEAGWSVLTVWECEVHDPKLPRHIKHFLRKRQ